MSRIGKQPIIIPEGVDVKLDDKSVMVKGPKGEITQKIHPKVLVKQEGDQIIVSVKNPDIKQQNALWGLYRKLIANAVAGVAEGFLRKLEVNGVGYKVSLSGNILNLQLGYSHPIEYKLPDGIEAQVEKNLITLSGVDKQLLGQTAAEIRLLRPPEPYKGKGIKYAEEIIRRKAGKAAAKGAEG